MQFPRIISDLFPFTIAPKGKAAKAKKESVMSRTYAVQVKRLRQDVGNWRDALERAEGVYFPDRTSLLTVYADLVLDLHLSSVLETRKINVLRQRWKLQDAAGEAQPALTKLLRKAWFRDFCSLALEKIPYGHSLIEFEPGPAGYEFGKVTLVPRQYVSPELGIVRTMPGMITGTDFRNDPAFSPWLIEVGAIDDLGLLNKAAMFTICKKNVIGAWADFTELFGMPFRSVSTDAEGEDLDRIEEALENMGQAAYGVFPEGTEVKFIQAATANERLYDLFIERTNSELSKLILGQTMTTDSGSSRSQSEVHERVADAYTADDSEFLLTLINDTLIPFLIRHGYPLQGCEFVWDQTVTLPKAEQFKIVQGVMQYSGHQVSRKYLEETFGVEFDDEQPAAAAPAGGGGKPGDEGGPAGPAAPDVRPILGYHIEAGVVDRNEARAQLNLPEQDESEAIAQRRLKAQLSVLQAATVAGVPLEAALKLAGLQINLPAPAEPTAELPGKSEGSPADQPVSPTAALTALYAGSCCPGHGAGVATVTAEADERLLSLMDRLMQVIYANNSSALGDELPAEALPLYEYLNEQLQEAIELAWNAPDPALKAFLQKNVQRFSGFKTYKVCQEMTQKLFDAEGLIVDFETFKKEALLINQQYNVQYLKTEYEHAVASTQMASKWAEFEEDGLLQYRTVGDDLVRPEHRKFDGITLPKSHPWWSTHYPPLDWNCRCDTIEVFDEPETGGELLQNLPEVPKLFQHNVGATGKLFAEDHPYFEQPEKVKRGLTKQLKLAL